jgi:hypothetical protein
MLKEAQLGLFEAQPLPSLDRPTIGQDAERKLGSVWNKAAEDSTRRARPSTWCPT